MLCSWSLNLPAKFLFFFTCNRPDVRKEKKKRKSGNWGECKRLSLFVRACSVMSDSVTPWTIIHQSPQSMGFSRQENWSGLPIPTPGDLPNPGIKPSSHVSPALAGRFFTTAPPGKPLSLFTIFFSPLTSITIYLAINQWFIYLTR